MLLLLSACTVGPNFSPPATTMPATFPSTATTQPSQTTPTDPAITQWWSAFNDPELTGLIQSAIANNLDERIAISRIRQSRASSKIVFAQLFPTLDSSGAFTRSRTPIPVPPGGQTSNAFRAGFDAAWEVDIFGGVRRNLESASADTQTAIENLRNTQVTLAAEVATNYITYRALQEQLKITQESLATDRANLTLVQKKLAGGMVGSLDVANAQAQVHTTESQIPLLQSNMQQTLYALSILLALDPTSLDHTLSAAPIPSAPATIPIGLPSDLLHRRPDIRAAESQIHSATAKIGVAQADLFPKFSLTGSLALQSSQITSFANWNNRLWSFGPTVTWNIFDAGRINANIDLQKSLTDESLLTYFKTILNALSEVDSALAAFGNEQTRRDYLTQAVEANTRAVDAAQKLYKAGQTDFLNVLNAQRSLLSSRQSLAQSQRDIANNLVSLYKALGGGWQPPAPTIQSTK